MIDAELRNQCITQPRFSAVLQHSGAQPSCPAPKARRRFDERKLEEVLDNLLCESRIAEQFGEHWRRKADLSSREGSVEESDIVPNLSREIGDPSAGVCCYHSRLLAILAQGRE